jgi:ketosteroid isomerase-like protein
MRPFEVRLTILLVAALSCVHPVLTTDSLKTQILELEQQRQQAQLRGDWKTIQTLNAPEFSEIAGTGLIRTGAQNAEDMRSGRLKFDKVDYTEQQVRLYGDVAIVTGIGHRSGAFNGQPFEQRFRYTRIYARQDGGWKVVLAQTTRIEAPAL